MDFNFNDTSDLELTNINFSMKFTVPVCDGTEKLCVDPAMEWTVNIINIVAVGVNILHMIVLRKIDTLQGTPYLKILLSMAISDILCAVMSVPERLCMVRRFLSTSHQAYTATLSIIASTFIGFRYYHLAFAALNQFYTICFPLHYAGSVIATKTSLALGFVFMFTMTMSIIKDSVFSGSLCIDTMYGPTNESPSVDNITGAKIITIVLSLVPLVFIILLSVLVLVELCKMRKRAHTGQQQDSINATKYILTIVAVFIMCLCPLYVDLLIDLQSYPTLALVLDWFSIVAFMLYGIVNTVIYGWKNKTYRSVFCQLIKDCCFLTNKCCNNSVHPTV